MCQAVSQPTQPTAPPEAGSDRFMQRMIDTLNGAAIALMTSIGHRTGLFDAMSRLPGAATTHEIAAAAGMNERYVREWLGAMTTARVVEHDPVEKTYRLPSEHAAVLTRAAAPNNMAASTQWIAILGQVETQVVDAFRHGQGVPYGAYARFHEVMAEESAQTVVAGLFDHILPAVQGLTEKLDWGIDVLDVGCGSGLALNTIAAAYPRSRFVGYDFSSEAVAAARNESIRRGLDNVRFETRDIALLNGEIEGGFDLVTAFDAIHDQARPADVLRNIRSAVKPGGTFLMQDILAHSCHHQNMDNPFAPFIYTISCMHCMSVSLAHGGPGLGAAWGRERALQMLADAGFEHTRVEQLAHDPLNFYYISTVA